MPAAVGPAREQPRAIRGKGELEERVGAGRGGGGGARRVERERALAGGDGDAAAAACGEGGGIAGTAPAFDQRAVGGPPEPEAPVRRGGGRVIAAAFDRQQDRSPGGGGGGGDRRAGTGEEIESALCGQGGGDRRVGRLREGGGGGGQPVASHRRSGIPRPDRSTRGEREYLRGVRSGVVRREQPGGEDRVARRRGSPRAARRGNRVAPRRPGR
ncbi:MAG: hypothetical protein R3F11_27895 [Verrucomicrobiales bacterium]